MLVKSAITSVLKFPKTPRVSLGRYFPKGTVYFYGYPSCEDSGFLNKVPPHTEELVSARPMVCEGGDISVITFAATVRSDILQYIEQQAGLSLLATKRTLVFPDHIGINLQGKQRDEQIKQHLKKMVKPNSLVMAQPFLDDDINHLYQISPKLTNWLNDKQHMASYVPEELLAKRYGSFDNGQAFAKSRNKLPIPCVVKVSSSSAGDGVYICKDQRSLAAVKTVLKNTLGTIIIDKYIEAATNYGIQFGIPEDSSLPIDIIGINEQLTTPEGEFIGGVVEPGRAYPELNDLKDILGKEILPQIRELGWYGVGCFDVLVDAKGQCFIIDCNFRMTGMTAYLMLSANGHIRSPLVSFGGEFHGGLAQFQDTIASAISANDAARPVRIISLTEHYGVCRFNAALVFENRRRLPVMARQLLQAGIISKALEQLARPA